MKRRLGMWIAVVIELTAAGCGRSGPYVGDPEGGRIQFHVFFSQGDSDLYNSWEFCWEGTLDTAQGSSPGDDETSRTFQNIPGGQDPPLSSPLSEQLRAGTWRVRARVKGFTASGSEALINVTDCTNFNGERPTVYVNKTTIVPLSQGVATCEWYPTDVTTTPNMGEGVVQPCSPDP